MQNIAELLQHDTTDVTTDVTPDAIRMLMDYCPAVLLDLNLQHNNLSDVGTLAVTQALTEQAHLLLKGGLNQCVQE